MFPFLLAVALTFSPSDAHRAYETAGRFVGACTPRDAGTPGGRAAADFIFDAAGKAGVAMTRDSFTVATPKGQRCLANLYGAFKFDASKPWVVLVSHYDTKTGVDCPGANDGASTTALLIAFAHALSRWQDPAGNVLLVWTDGEECMERYGETDGLLGAKRAAAYVRGLKGVDVRAVICLDMLGDADLKISIPANGSEALTRIAFRAARKAGYPNLINWILEYVTDDHVPFLEGGYKAIDMIDFEYGPGNSYWHTTEDNMSHISEASLLKTGRVVAEMLNILL